MSSPSSHSPNYCECRDGDPYCPCKIPSPAPVPCVNPVARVLLAAVHKPSPNSPFAILSQCPDVIPIIYAHLRHAWREAIIPPPARVTRRGTLRDQPQPHLPLSQDERSRVGLCHVRHIHFPFPKPTGLYCNMLPFLSTDLSTIPPEYDGYLHHIRACAYYVAAPEEHVWYLTIHESKLEPGRPQRRAGLHVEGFLAKPSVSLQVPEWHAWGVNASDSLPQFDGGIFHLSSVTGSCRMWNAQIPRASSDVLHVGCDVDHLRGVLTDVVQPVLLGEDELYWFTDATPHESLPCDAEYRQYFRLVVGKISAWWEKHSTPNRLGVQPACRILKHDKFGKDAYIGFDTDQTGVGGNTEELGE